MSFFVSPRASHVRRAVAVCSVVLATGGLVLYRSSPSAAFPGDSSLLKPSPSALQPGKNSAVFSGPGAHGQVSLSHTSVLGGAPTSLFAEVTVVADPQGKSDQVHAPLAMAVVLDTSGSMSGEKIEEARRSVIKLVSDMRDDDEITFIRYSDNAELIQPLARVGTVRESLVAQIRQITAGGGTNIPSGMSAGLRALDEAARGRVRRIVLVSDGLDNTRRQAEALAQNSFARGITVSSLGIGVDFDESYMGSLAQNGHGNFGFVKDGASLAKFLHRELEETATTTVENARVRLHLPAGVRFVRASGADATPSGSDIDLALGSLFAGDERRVIVELVANATAGAELPIDTDASWSVVGHGDLAQVKVPKLTLLATNDASAVERGQDGAVLASATSVIASQRQMEASSAYAQGNVALAAQITDENQRALVRARAAAPAPAAAALDQQMAAYGTMKHGFTTIAPSSEAGRAAAKEASAKDMSNIARKAKY